MSNVSSDMNLFGGTSRRAFSLRVRHQLSRQYSGITPDTPLVGPNHFLVFPVRSLWSYSSLIISLVFFTYLNAVLKYEKQCNPPAPYCECDLNCTKLLHLIVFYSNFPHGLCFVWIVCLESQHHYLDRKESLLCSRVQISANSLV